MKDKFVLITNTKSHMSFRLVPNSVTLNVLERRNSPNRRVISLNLVFRGGLRRKGRDGQNEKIDKAKQRKGKVKRAKDEKVMDKGEEGCASPTRG